jgi:hypothetical protein
MPQRYIFEITDETRYQDAMTRALGALLNSLYADRNLCIPQWQ